MPSHRQTSRPTAPRAVLPALSPVRATVLTLTAATVATAAAAISGPTAGAAPRTRPASPEKRVQELFAEVERATEKYNAAKERTEELHGRSERIADRAARVAEQLGEARGLLAAAAGAQYRSGGVDPGLGLLLSRDPEAYLAKAATLERISSLQSGRLTRLLRLRRELEQQRTEAAAVLRELERARETVARDKRAVTAKLAAMRRLVAALPEGAEGIAAPGAAGRGYGSGTSPESAGPASSSYAGRAVAAARRAVGTPYLWGGASAGGFDCSGLTQWAYREAGVAIPRTSQGQRYAGRQVGLGQAMPGDLVTYRGDASHVGIYMGGGQVVHAPYPGAQVRYDPVGMMPIASVTRP
ncbi:NlpC/P60 family protein [Streptomyces polyrhachis]|uniref:NlpC/P60 family protein n=1 Tax=Streptomyces polyrhachis TaxID=1282885 RepID=A0ABW2G7N6_9ACTN